MNRLQRAFIAIEVWTRHTGGKNQKDEMIGLAKVSTASIASTYQISSEATVSTRAAAVGELLVAQVMHQ